MKVTTFTINPFAFVWIGLSIFAVMRGYVSWWIPTLIFLSHIELTIKIPVGRN